MIVLIDNGHGSNTAGKRSPDGRHREYSWTRMFAERLLCVLSENGIDARRVVTETRDISISERCARVNAVCREYGKDNVVLLSVHNNAVGSDGQWKSARGWSAHVSMNASAKSKELASLLVGAVEARGIKVRKYAPSIPYWTQNLGICRDTNCPAVLTENLFQDNWEDVDLLRDETFLETLSSAYLEGIRRYIAEVTK